MTEQKSVFLKMWAFFIVLFLVFGLIPEIFIHDLPLPRDSAFSTAWLIMFGLDIFAIALVSVLPAWLISLTKKGK